MIPQILGGVGLFLLGMILLTDTLKAVAGETVRNTLSRATRGRFSSLGTSTLITTLLQSSSATVLATIGFVSAGLLAFPQAILVILGAAIGTTSTGWLVSLLGLRFSISALALPLVGLGALLRLLGRGRATTLGGAIAGFGLIFVGIDTLQAGMQDLSGQLDPARLPGGTLGGRLLLVLVGIAMTVVAQSSSAAVATTLAALHAGTLVLPQAAALVVGHSIGTAVTAAIAAIGASVPAKRTALSHIIFNAVTGVVAFLLIPAFLAAVELTRRHMGMGDDPVSIAAFHTAFTVTGALLFLPFLSQYAGLIARIVPERHPALTRHLDPTVASITPVAVEASRRAAIEVADLICRVATHRLERLQPDRWSEAALAEADQALSETRRFLGGISTEPEQPRTHARHVTVLHAIDHLERLTDALRDTSPLTPISRNPQLQELSRRILPGISMLRTWIEDQATDPPINAIQETSIFVAETRRQDRPAILARTAEGATDPDTALRQLDAARWLDRLAYHIWRATVHLAGTPVSDEEPVMEAFPEEEPRLDPG